MSKAYYIRERKGYLYVCVPYVDPDTGKKAKNPKWIKTGLKAANNKRKAAEIAPRLVAEFLDSLKHGAKPKKEGVPETIAAIGAEWLEERKKEVEKGRLRQSTYEGYVIHFTRHILPYIGGMKPEELNIDNLQEWIDQMGADGAKAKSIKEYKSALHLILKYGVRRGYCERVDSLDYVILPKIEKKQYTVYDKAFLDKIIQETRGTMLGDILLVACLYGLRRSEIVGLRWGQIDRRAGVLHINHTVVRVTGTIAEDKTKSAASHRDFPLLAPIEQMFCRRYKRAEAEGLPVGPEDYVFTWPDGQYKGQRVGLDYATTAMKKMLEKYGLPKITLHGLRHSVASVLISDGYQLEDIKDWMGHADISTTSDVYGHMFGRRKQQIGATMAGMLQS